MRVLDRYIIRSLGASVALVMAVLLTLLGLFLFINEQGWVGVGRYGNWQALRFVLLNLPSLLFLFLPVAVLIGSLLALGALARANELTVMRASGVSVGRIACSVLMAGLILVPPAFVMSEYLAPPLLQQARIGKAADRNTNISLAGRNGAWIHDGEVILRAERQSGDAAFGGITVFQLDANGGLQSVGRAPGARALADGSWELQQFAQSRFDETGVAFDTNPAYRLASQVSPAFFGVIATDPMELSLRELQRARSFLERNGQETRHYRFAFWSTIARLFAIPLAALLAVPFVLGSLRGAESGTRLTLGLLLGLGYFILQRMVESGTIAFGLDPLLLAWLPTLLLAVAVGTLLLRRMFSAV